MIRITSKYQIIIKVSFFAACNYVCNPLEIFRCKTNFATLDTEMLTVFSLN